MAPLVIEYSYGCALRSLRRRSRHPARLKEKLWGRRLHHYHVPCEQSAAPLVAEVRSLTTCLQVSSEVLSITEIEAVLNGYGAHYYDIPKDRAVVARKWYDSPHGLVDGNVG